jgi:hypothetical protein
VAYIESLRATIVALWRRFFYEPTEVHRTLVMRDGGAIVVTSSYLLGYEHTLVGQHMVSAERGMRERVRRLTAAQFDLFDWTGARWQLALMNKVNAGAQALFLPGTNTSSRWYSRRDVGLYALESPEEVPAPELRPGCVIEPVTAEDEERVVRLIRAADGEAFADADSIRAGELRLPESVRRFAALGLVRERELLILREGPAVRAVVTVQRATAGIAFSQLLHVGRLYLVEPYVADADARALLRAAVAWHRDRGERWVWWLAVHPRERALLVAEGFSHTDDAVQLVVHRRAFQAYQHDLALSIGAEQPPSSRPEGAPGGGGGAVPVAARAAETPA